MRFRRLGLFVCLGMAPAACRHVPPTGDLACRDVNTPAPPGPGRTDSALSAAQREWLIAQAHAHRAAWEARRITSYRIRVAVGCFCPWPPQPRILEVRNGTAVALFDSTGRPDRPLREPWSGYTVPGLFQTVEQLARSADVVGVRYDPCLGYPTAIRGDQKLGRVDDWFWFTATDLAPRR